VGLDISRPAARATLKNARENGLAGALTAVQGHTECLKASFELVAANLPWEVQMEKAAELDRLAASGGRLILSGFRDNQESLLLKSYLGRGWRLRQRVAQDFFHPELPADMSFGWAGWLLEK
jgi:ribosomal protein L11 methylase PrmA